MMHIYVDRELCIGSEVCVDRHPDIFSLDDENVAVRDPAAEDELDESTRREIVLGCPSGALYLQDEQGNRIDLD
jgi:ferredoxin